MITYPIPSNFCKKRFSGILLALQFSIFLGSSFMALQFSIFLASSFIEGFLFISFQWKWFYKVSYKIQMIQLFI